MTPRTRIKICCMASLDEARMAIAAGADAIGLVSEMPSGPGPIDEETIATIAVACPPAVSTFLLTALTDVDAIAAQQARCRTSVIQLVDALPAGGVRALVAALPGIKIVPVVHVRDEGAVEEARSAAGEGAHAVLLDSGNPDLAVKELGGTGRVHDWRISRRIVEAVEVPVFLAGGLRPLNVKAAIDAVRPFGVDLCSGVRVNGHLDPEALTAFVAAVRGADGA